MTTTPSGLRTIERRVYVTEFRAVKGSERQKWATAVTYDTVDDFGTIWNRGVFDKALSERMPTMLFGHDWGNLTHVLGKGVDFRQTPDEMGPPGVDVLIEFDDPEFVPMNRQVLHQLDVRTLRDVSVGFARHEWLDGSKLAQEDRQRGAKERMMEAAMDELSIVIRGAVTGAQMRGARSVRTAAGEVIAEDAIIGFARKVAAGELTHAEAKAAVALLSATPTQEAPPAEPEGAQAASEDDEQDSGAAAIEEALAAEALIDEALARP
jgi:hypothetical protein